MNIIFYEFLYSLFTNRTGGQLDKIVRSERMDDWTFWTFYDEFSSQKTKIFTKLTILGSLTCKPKILIFGCIKAVKHRKPIFRL
jgi:hypothetical protein